MVNFAHVTAGWIGYRTDLIDSVVTLTSDNISWYKSKKQLLC